MSARLHVVPSPDHRRVGTIRVVLADGHAAMRRSLRSVLESAGGIEVIADAENPAAATQHVHANRPHVLVFGFNIRDRSGADVLCNLRQTAPATQVVVVTMDQNPTLAELALTVGAAGFVLKDTADDELVEAVRHAARGEGYTSPRVARQSEREHLRQAWLQDARRVGPLGAPARRARPSPRSAAPHRPRPVRHGAVGR